MNLSYYDTSVTLSGLVGRLWVSVGSRSGLGRLLGVALY